MPIVTGSDAIITVTIVKAGAALHFALSFQYKTIQLSAYKHIMFDAVICYEYRHMCLRDTQTYTQTHTHRHTHTHTPCRKFVRLFVACAKPHFSVFFKPNRAELLGSVDGFMRRVSVRFLMNLNAVYNFFWPQTIINVTASNCECIGACTSKGRETFQDSP
jgi:hypothetical protein